MAQRNPKVPDVDDYPERPYDEAKMDEAEIAFRENRATEDQIADYHQEHPTLDTTGKEHDVEYQAKAYEKAQPEPTDSLPE